MIKLDPIKIGDSIIWKMKLKNAFKSKLLKGNYDR